MRSRTREATRFLSPLLLAGVAAGCRAGDAEPTVVTRDSTGVQIVESSGPAWDEGAAWTVDTVPSLDIGASETDPVYQLHDVSQALRLGDGTIIVVTGEELRFYTADGTYLRTAGGTGRGPGEFVSIAGVIATDGDSLMVFDNALERVSVLDSTGAFARSFRLESTGNPIHPLRMRHLAGLSAAGDLLLTVRAWPADMRPEPVVYWDTVANLIYGPDGSLADTMGEFSGMDTYSTPERSGDVHFGRFSFADVRAGHLYITDGGHYEVRVYDPVALVRVIRVLRDPRPVTERDIAARDEFYLSRARDDNRRRELNRYLSEWAVAEHKPWIRGLVVDALGYVWVQEYQPFWDQSAPTWSVFDPEGRWLGTLQLPARLRVFQIGGDYVLGMWRDALDVEHVRLYEVDRSDDGSDSR